MKKCLQLFIYYKKTFFVYNRDIIICRCIGMCVYIYVCVWVDRGSSISRKGGDSCKRSVLCSDVIRAEENKQIS